MTRHFKRLLVLISGWSFVALGVVGIFLPFLQGALFLLIGITILASEYIWARKLLKKLRDLFPRLSRQIDAAPDRAHKWLKRIFPEKSDGAQN